MDSIYTEFKNPDGGGVAPLGKDHSGYPYFHEILLATLNI